MTWLARACGLLILVLAFVAARMTSSMDFDPEPRTPTGITSPILGLELARTGDEVRALFRDPMGWHNRNVYRDQVRQDGAFIACYGALLAGLGSLAAFRKGARWRLAAVATIALAAAAAFFDVRENRAMLTMAGTDPLELTDDLAQATRLQSLLKWACFFGALAPISANFLTAQSADRRARAVARITGAFLAGAAILGLIGILHVAAIPWATILASLGFLATLALVAIWPEASASMP
ncbi:hypothetical protein [Aquisphaera insulae]|uniref:hypothetical protein n=1 Tax=Aquisphaera insulae TaxID=2712864 RepID=UPI0013EDF69E|nr:hypothetical protein [Aquisphaera insulae]